MNVHLYTRCFNDAHMLEFFFRHYDGWVQRYHVYDDGSTDGSIEILRAHPNVEIRSLSSFAHSDSFTLRSLEFAQNCWKESRGRADWVVVTDVDEHLYHADVPGYLRRCKRSGITAIPALGYQMISNVFPPSGVRLSETIRNGAPWSNMSKLGIFSPDDIEAAGYGLGRHSAEPKGNVVIPAREELLLLHYKYLDLERTHKRHEAYEKRRKPLDVEEGWGHKYGWTFEELTADWEKVGSRTVDVLDSNLRPWETHDGERWWNQLECRRVSVDVVVD